MRSWIEVQRDRCGPLVDAALMFGASLGVELDPPAGEHGLLALSRAIESYLGGEHEEQDERVFIEGAGAFLGVLLCDALGEGEHEERDGHHGLRLGALGFFDPFVAIEHALAAEDVRRTLAAEVAVAEQMLSGRPDDFEARAPERRWAAIAPNLLPRLVGPRFFERLGGRDAARLYVQRFHADVQICFAIRNGAHVRYLRRDELSELGRAPSVIAGLAVRNLARASKSARLLRIDGAEGPLVVAQSRDGLDAARLLLPGLHDVLAPELGSPFVAAIPHRDMLLACAASPLGARRALAERAHEEAVAARLAISAALFEVARGGRIRAL